MKTCRPLDRERGWWNQDLEGGMENLAVEGTVSVTASGSKNPEWKGDHWSAGAVITSEECEGVRLAVTERQEING